MKFEIVFVVGLVFVALAGEATASEPVDTDWEASLYNPGQPAAGDDVILPMPCGGAMAFRKVDTSYDIPGDGLFGDHQVTLGDAAQAEDIYVTNAIDAYIVGGFGDIDKGKRYFLMGKYEITQLQYAVVMKDAAADCPKPNEGSAFPQHTVNWFDAVEFGKRYSVWLQQNAFADLPKKDNEPGFVRLPTEIEWEYAARGGQVVSPTQYQQATYFPETEAAQYAWFYQPANEGKLMKIGLLKPNPLGLYDVLGNVDEIVFDLFHLRHQRKYYPHGEAGGFVLRGGNYQSKELSAAKRFEAQFFDAGKLWAGAPTAGFRVAVSAPVMTESNFEQFGQAWQQSQTNSVLSPEVQPREQPLAMVNAIRDATQDNKPLKNQLDALQTELVEQRRAYEEQLGRAAFEAFRTAGILCQKLDDDQEGLVRQEAFCKKQADTFNLEKCSPSHLAERQQLHQFNSAIYADAIINLAHYDLKVVKQQQERWLQIIAKSEYQHIAPYLQVVYGHVEQRVTGKKVSPANWSDACASVK